MAAWRRRATSDFPELREEDAEPLTSVNAFFFWLLPMIRQAHRDGDDGFLRRGYAFAQWAHHQRHGSELGNAVAVAFYEHLFDDWSLRSDVVAWLDPSVRRDVWPLWEDRLEPARLAALRTVMADEHPQLWRTLRAT